MINLQSYAIVKGNRGATGIGGLFRDDQGKWMRGFHEKIGNTTNLIAELWNIRTGLQIQQVDFGI